MCGSLQLTTGERMKTELAIRRQFPELERYPFGGFLRSEGIRQVEGLQNLTWGSGTWRGLVDRILPLPVLGFSERDRTTLGRGQVWFPQEGTAFVAVVRDPFHDGLEFRLITRQNETTRREVAHDRAPLIIPVSVAVDTHGRMRVVPQRSAR